MEVRLAMTVAPNRAGQSSVSTEDSCEETPSYDLTQEFDPRIECTEMPHSYILIAYVPGFKKEDVKVEIDNATCLVISGEKCMEEMVMVGWTWHRMERTVCRRFRSRFKVDPDSVNIDDIGAKFQDGVLYVILPKLALSDIRDVHAGKMDPQEEEESNLEKLLNMNPTDYDNHNHNHNHNHDNPNPQVNSAQMENNSLHDHEEDYMVTSAHDNSGFGDVSEELVQDKMLLSNEEEEAARDDPSGSQLSMLGKEVRPGSEGRMSPSEEIVHIVEELEESPRGWSDVRVSYEVEPINPREDQLDRDNKVACTPPSPTHEAFHQRLDEAPMEITSDNNIEEAENVDAQIIQSLAEKEDGAAEDLHRPQTPTVDINPHDHEIPPEQEPAQSTPLEPPRDLDSCLRTFICSDQSEEASTSDLHVEEEKYIVEKLGQETLKKEIGHHEEDSSPYVDDSESKSYTKLQSISDKEQAMQSPHPQAEAAHDEYDEENTKEFISEKIMRLEEERVERRKDEDSEAHLHSNSFFTGPKILLSILFSSLVMLVAHKAMTH
eukprot:Gb_39008 [translate_table: standard]